MKLFLICFISAISASSAVSTPVVVLPERFANSEVIVKNSQAYNALEKQSRELAKQLAAEQTEQKKFAAGVDKNLQQTASRLERLEQAQARSTHRFPIWNVLLLA